MTRQSVAAGTGTPLWDRLHRSWGSKNPAATLDSVVTRQYPGKAAGHQAEESAELEL